MKASSRHPGTWWKMTQTQINTVEGAIRPPEWAQPVPVIRWGMLDYTPNAWAYYNVHARDERFKYLCTCRQCGKSFSLAAEIDAAMTSKPDAFGPPEVCVLSWRFDKADGVVQRWLRWATAADGLDAYYVNSHEHVIRNKSTGATLWWFSSDDPYTTQRYTFSHVFVEEAQRVQDMAISVLRPAMDVRESRLLAFGTPDTMPEQTWFRGGWLRGQMSDQKSYHSFTLDCWGNPWMKYDAIVEARNDPAMTEAQFRMLYLGQWVDLEGRFFTKFKHCFTGGRWEKEPLPEGDYVMGLDLAKQHDYTVAYILDRTRGAVVHTWRLNRTDYDLVEDEVVKLYKKWNCSRAVVDSTSGYEIMADMLRRQGLNVWAYDFASGNNKADLCVNLNRLLTRGSLILPPDAQLERELDAFLVEETGSGRMRYKAPNNFFDDCVMALGLAALTMKHGAIQTGNTLGYSYIGQESAGDNPW